MGFMVVIEVNPCSLRAACCDPVSPFRKLVREPGPATGAEDYAGLTKRRIYGLVPPAGVTELNDVAPCGIELADNGRQPGLRIAMAWWKLKQKAPHSVAEDIGDHAKILY